MTGHSHVGLGVVVGRFQVPLLTAAHCRLIEYVATHSDRLLIVIGSIHQPPSALNPLPYEARRDMVQSIYSHVEIKGIPDRPGDNLGWSEQLDYLINNSAHLHGGTVRLFGGRKSFIDRYTGRYPTEVVPSPSSCSGTHIRSTCATTPHWDNVYFRRGVIWATQQTPTVPDPPMTLIPAVPKRNLFQRLADLEARMDRVCDWKPE